MILGTLTVLNQTEHALDQTKRIIVATLVAILEAFPTWLTQIETVHYIQRHGQIICQSEKNASGLMQRKIL